MGADSHNFRLWALVRLRVNCSFSQDDPIKGLGNKCANDGRGEKSTASKLVQVKGCYCCWLFENPKSHQIRLKSYLGFVNKLSEIGYRESVCASTLYPLSFIHSMMFSRS